MRQIVCIEMTSSMLEDMQVLEDGIQDANLEDEIEYLTSLLKKREQKYGITRLKNTNSGMNQFLVGPQSDENNPLEA